MLSILQQIKSFCSETLVMLMYYKSVLKTLYTTFMFEFSNKLSLFPQKDIGMFIPHRLCALEFQSL